MLQYVLGTCALACPISMLAMMWFMRGRARRARKD